MTSGYHLVGPVTLAASLGNVRGEWVVGVCASFLVSGNTERGGSILLDCPLYDVTAKEFESCRIEVASDTPPPSSYITTPLVWIRTRQSLGICKVLPSRRSKLKNLVHRLIKKLRLLETYCLDGYQITLTMNM